jgi:uncharacterized protein (DUF305 family)
MKNKSKIFLSLACTALLAGPVVAQQSDSMQMHEHMGMQGSANAATAPYDAQFIDTMIRHHQMAIDMMKLVDQRAAHADLKSMARKGMETQQQEIQQLQDWKAAWYPDKQDAINMKMPGMMESMKGMSMDKLSSTNGDAFDRMFIDMMSKHHRGAVAMGKDAIKKATHPELKQLAQKIIDEQTEEVAQMARWKKEWNLVSK